MKLIFVLITIISFAHCNEKVIVNDDIRFENEVYSILDYLLPIRFAHTAVVEAETMPIFKSLWGTTKPSNKNITPPALIHYYDRNKFQNFSDSMLLNPMEAKFMYDNIDSSKVIKIDSGRIHLPVIHKAEVIKIFQNEDRDESYNIIKRTYGESCILNISTPIFNSEYTKAIISFDYACGFLDVQSFQFVMEKKGNKWSILNEIDTWSE